MTNKQPMQCCSLVFQMISTFSVERLKRVVDAETLHIKFISTNKWSYILSSIFFFYQNEHMQTMTSIFFIFFIATVSFLPSPSSSSSSVVCSSRDLQLIVRAFASTRGVLPSDLESSTTCTDDNRTEIHLSSRNISGTISWMFLHGISTLRVVDLSKNRLHGYIPTTFWASDSLLQLNLASNRVGGTVRFKRRNGFSSLRKLDLSDNRFTNSAKVSGFVSLRYLDLSGNNLRKLPMGVEKLRELSYLDISRCNISGNVKSISLLASLKYLDLSGNQMTGFFPVDFPAIYGLVFLNVSFNNFSGMVRNEEYTKFGESAFLSAGVIIPTNNFSSSSSTTKPTVVWKPSKMLEKKENGFPLLSKVGIACIASIGGAASLGMGALVVFLCCRYLGNIKNKKRKQEADTRSIMDTEAPWVAKLTGTSTGPIAPVIMFEKPLMKLTFSDLVAATSGFGKESQLTEGEGSGPVYRAILPGDIDIAIKVLEKARTVEVDDAKSTFNELAAIKHQNILPLIGYCIAGKEKLLLCEYMENGDLHRWLHELPLMETDKHGTVEDWNVENDTDAVARVRTDLESWATRYRIALGIARGLAFLHHAASKKPIVHGKVAPSNILLDGELNPKIIWIQITKHDELETDTTTESDVYGYGMLLFELLTGHVRSDDTLKWIREILKDGNGLTCLDPRIQVESDKDDREIAQSLRVAYLCTSQKRPSMRQVVGLMKDIRPFAV